MQRLRIELLPRSYDLPPRHLPRQPACFVTHSPAAGVSYSVRRMLSRSCDAAIVMQIVICHSHVWQKIGPSRHRSAQVKAYSAGRRLPSAREPTEILPSTRNATAQPGRSRPRCRAAFLPLARSYRMKGMPRASLQCRSAAVTEGGIAARIVMVRQREGGQRAELTLVSRAMRCHPEE
jgi:hypothetical protein